MSEYRRVWWRRQNYHWSAIHLTANRSRTACGTAVPADAADPDGPPLPGTTGRVRRRTCRSCEFVVSGATGTFAEQLAARERNFRTPALAAQRERLAAAIRRFADELNGGLAPSHSTWNELGPALGYPSSSRITQVFGRWSDAMTAAGLAPNDGPPHGHARRFTVDDCLAAVRACAEETGSIPTSKDYDEWQKSKRPVVAKGAHGPYPSAPTVYNRDPFRSWGSVLEAAFGDRAG